MTKKDLERRNKFLLLELKIIRELLSDNAGIEKYELYKKLGRVDSHTDPEEIKKRIKFIEENDLKYNFYSKSMDISEYED